MLLLAIGVLAGALLVFLGRPDRRIDEALEASLRADVAAAVEETAQRMARETVCDLGPARALVSQAFRDRKLIS